ncbi:hypothetical protein ACFWYW_50530 [Nonomuraea sp. NPDC059023]|uniref:hypothetical protein n=1 Tax=unclassified Nonomuraea TaxID=2593643 RepID=UPI003689433A
MAEVAGANGDGVLAADLRQLTGQPRKRLSWAGEYGGLTFLGLSSAAALARRAPATRGWLACEAIRTEIDACSPRAVICGLSSRH